MFYRLHTRFTSAANAADLGVVIRLGRTMILDDIAVGVAHEERGCARREFDWAARDSDAVVFQRLRPIRRV